MPVTLIVPSYQRFFCHMSSYTCRVSFQIIRGNTHTFDGAEARKLQPELSALETPPKQIFLRGRALPAAP